MVEDSKIYVVGIAAWQQYKNITTKYTLC